MSPTINPSKPLMVTFNSSVENARVTVFNRNTGEYKHTDDKGAELRINNLSKLVFDADWLDNGWTVGDVIEFVLSGKYYGSGTITLTAAANVPQKVSITVGTNALSAGGL